MASPIKRGRRTKAEIEAVCTSIYEVVEAGQPMTVRQVFYQLVTMGVIDKTENEYTSTVGRLLTNMRMAKELPFDWIADNTRWMRKPRTHSSLRSMLDLTRATYRRALWDNQDAYVEVWLEKDALAGVVYEITYEWDVPLMVTRGYASLSFLSDAAATIDAERKPAYLYYFGDWDPSGVDIPRVVEARLTELAPDADITFERVAVVPEQTERWGLPTRPTKKTDTRTKTFKGASVELDAIPPETLRSLVRGCIEPHVDAKALEQTQIAEASEMQFLEKIDDIFQGAGH